MSVTITWSETNGGDAITEVDHSSGSAGATLSESTIYIRHNGDNQISQCKFYLAESGSNPTTDLNEILSWGDAVVSTDFGGFQINMNASGGFPVSDWSTYDDKSGTNYNVFRTGAGDNSTNGILLAQAMGLTGSPGVIQAGDSPDVRFKCRIQIPSSVMSAGDRQFDSKLRFTFTS